MGLYSPIKANVYFGGNSCSNHSGFCAATGTPVAVEVMVNAVASVVWEPVDIGAVAPDKPNKINLGDNPEENGGGQRCFPEKDAPDGDVHNSIKLKVTLAENILPDVNMVAGVTLHYKIFDPPNHVVPCTRSDWHQGKQENNGHISQWAGTLTFSAGTNERTETFTITQAQPGDNYLAVFYTNADSHVYYHYGTNWRKPIVVSVTIATEPPDAWTPVPESILTPHEIIPFNHCSPVLTVWRTLNIEHDWMQGYEAEDTSLLVSELEKICIATHNLGGHEPSDPKKQEFQLPMFVNGVFKAPNNPRLGLEDDAIVANICQDSRWTGLVSSKDFWYVHLMRVNKISLPSQIPLNGVPIEDPELFFDQNETFQNSKPTQGFLIPGEEKILGARAQINYRNRHRATKTSLLIWRMKMNRGKIQFGNLLAHEPLGSIPK